MCSSLLDGGWFDNARLNMMSAFAGVPAVAFYTDTLRFHNYSFLSGAFRSDLTIGKTSDCPVRRRSMTEFEMSLNEHSRPPHAVLPPRCA